MNSRKIRRVFFISLIPFSIYHLVRDILQNYQVENFLTAFLKMNKNWCSSYCNYITIPFELFILVSALIVVKRNRTGGLGYLTVALFGIWIVMFLYDYFIYN